MIVNKRRPPANHYEVGAVRKALEILCQFGADTPSISVSDLSRQLKMPKSTTHNLLRTLEAYDMLKQDPADRRYRLGPRVFELGLRFSHTTRLVTTAQPHLRQLADKTRETVKLGILSDNEVLILAAIESPYQLHTRGDEGVRAQLHCTGLGKAILAALPTEDMRRIVTARGLPRLTPHTLITLSALEDELAATRSRGFTLDMEENEAGVVCVAAEIADPASGTVAAVSVSGPASRLENARVREYAGYARETARAIALALGPNSACRRRYSTSKKERA